MRSMLVAMALTLGLPSGAALADKAPPVCKARFEGTFTNGVRAEADAPDEPAARKIFESYAAEQNQQQKPAKGAPTPTNPPVMALDRVRRLADNCTGLQSFLVFR